MLVWVPYMLREATAHCFSPAESMHKTWEARQAARRTPLRWGNRPGTNRKTHPERLPRTRYTRDSYNRAIRRGIDKANATIRELALQTGQENPITLAYWHPNQLRHARATEIRRQFGLEATQVVLGHAKADVSQIYAERDLSLAARIMQQVG